MANFVLLSIDVSLGNAAIFHDFTIPRLVTGEPISPAQVFHLRISYRAVCPAHTSPESHSTQIHCLRQHVSFL